MSFGRTSNLINFKGKVKFFTFAGYLQIMKKVLKDRTEVKVRFGEVDSMGIVWHGNYVKYIEEGRESFGRKYGISYLELDDIRSRDGPDTYKKSGKQVMEVLELKTSPSNLQLLKLGEAANFFGKCHISLGG